MNSVRKYIYPFLLVALILLLLMSATIHMWQYKNNKSEFKKTIRQNLGVTTSVKPTRAGLFTYHYYLDTVTYIEPLPDTVQAPTISDTTLVVQPGTYQMFGKKFEFNKEGLYRIMQPESASRQLIVSRGDLFSLLSASSWIITHGVRDNKLTFNNWYNKACQAKVVVTCSRASLFTHKLLERFNIKSRRVYCNTPKPAHHFFNAHVMLEVLHPIDNYWFLVDVDNNRYFTQQGKALTMKEFYNCLHNNIPYSSVALSVDDPIDTQGENGLINENLIAEPALHAWYTYVTENYVVEDYKPE